MDGDDVALAPAGTTSGLMYRIVTWSHEVGGVPAGRQEAAVTTATGARYPAGAREAARIPRQVPALACRPAGPTLRGGDDAGRGTHPGGRLPGWRHRCRGRQGPGPRGWPRQGGWRQAGTQRGRGGNRRGGHPGHGHQGHRGAPRDGHPGGHHRARDVPGCRPGPRRAAHPAHGRRGRRGGDRDARAGGPGRHRARPRPPTAGPAALPGAPDGLRPRPRRAPRAGHGHLPRPGRRHGPRGRRPRGGQPAGHRARGRA